MAISGKNIVLNVANIRSYLANQSKLPFQIKDLVQIKEVSEFSNNNFVFSLKIKSKQKNQYYFLKQAQFYNRRSLQQNKPIPVHPGRIRGERDLILLLSRLWSKYAVPEIYLFDAKNYVLLLSDVSAKGKLLVREFNRHQVHPEIANTLGKYLGQLHATTYKVRTSIWLEPKWRQTMNWFFKEYLSHGVRNNLDGRSVEKFYSKVDKSPKSQIWGDPVYRNIFVKPGGQISCVDFDHTFPYDPMIDVAMLLSHWVWMWLRGNKSVTQDSERFLMNFFKSYWRVWKKQPKLTTKELTAMKWRLPRWIGLYLLSRTDGKSGSYFKAYPTWEAGVREFGLSLFSGNLNLSAKKFIDKIEYYL